MEGTRVRARGPPPGPRHAAVLGVVPRRGPDRWRPAGGRLMGALTDIDLYRQVAREIFALASLDGDQHPLPDDITDVVRDLVRRELELVQVLGEECARDLRLDAAERWRNATGR